VPAAAQSPSLVPSDEEIRKILAQRIDRDFCGVRSRLLHEAGGRATHGRATAVVLHQLGRDQRFPKIEGEPEQSWFGHKEHPIDPKILDGYVGKYQLNPTTVFVISNESGHLFTQANPGAPKIEMFPETPRDFFLKVVDGQATFEVDSRGRATAVILHENGSDQRAPRVE